MMSYRRVNVGIHDGISYSEALVGRSPAALMLGLHTFFQHGCQQQQTLSWTLLLAAAGLVTAAACT